MCLSMECTERVRVNMESLNTEQLGLLIVRMLKEQKKEEFQRAVDELQPYDLAETYSSLPIKLRHRFIFFLTAQQCAILIQELETEMQINILQMLGPKRSAAILDLMANDDLADILGQFSEETSEQFLSSMKKEESETVQDLMTYHPETAGGIMTNRFVWLRSYYTVREAIDKIKAFAVYAENIYYLYVIDEDKRLVGVVSYRDILLANLDDSIESFMYRRVISVPVDMDQEDVARVIERYDFIAVPVVDEEQRLQGIVTVDDVIDVMIEEAHQDIERLSASGKGIDFKTGALSSTFRRLPWLFLLLVLGLISGSIIAAFEDTLNKQLALAFFMPMIAGMTGNTGTQSLAIVVRGLASDDIDRKTIFKLLIREIIVGINIGLVCGGIVFLSTSYFLGIDISFVVGLSLVFTLIIGTFAGTVIPLILYRFKIDPAIASGPLITTLNDIFSLTIYFGLASATLSHLL